MRCFSCRLHVVLPGECCRGRREEAATLTLTVVMVSCTLALTQPMVKLPWPWPLTRYACYSCDFVIIVVNTCSRVIDRYALSGDANGTTVRSVFVHIIATLLKYLFADINDKFYTFAIAECTADVSINIV